VPRRFSTLCTRIKAIVANSDTVAQQCFASKEMMMTIDSVRRFVRRRRFQWVLPAILCLLALGLVGYIAVVPVYVAAPQMGEASWFVLTDQAVSSETAPETLNAQAKGVATAALRAESPRPRK
jgi:hypothetical protein